MIYRSGGSDRTAEMPSKARVPGATKSRPLNPQELPTWCDAVARGM